MKPISVLVVDDSVVIRRIVSNILAEDADIRVVGSAASGRIALEKISRLHPDIMTLDIDMPDMDGLATLRELRRLRSKLPVIMFSTATERAAAATLEALSLGARDYVTKPSDLGSPNAAIEAIRRELIPRIKALAGRGPDGRPGQYAGGPLRFLPRPSRRPVLGRTRSSPSERRPADRTPSPRSSATYRVTYRCRSSLPSTCRRCSPGFLQPD